MRAAAAAGARRRWVGRCRRSADAPPRAPRPDQVAAAIQAPRDAPRGPALARGTAASASSSARATPSGRIAPRATAEACQGRGGAAAAVSWRGCLFKLSAAGDRLVDPPMKAQLQQNTRKARKSVEEPSRGLLWRRRSCAHAAAPMRAAILAPQLNSPLSRQQPH